MGSGIWRRERGLLDDKLKVGIVSYSSAQRGCLSHEARLNGWLLKEHKGRVSALPGHAGHGDLAGRAGRGRRRAPGGL